MSGVNKVILVGRLGKDPEVRTLENGATVANFSLATTEVYRDRTSGERKETTPAANAARNDTWSIDCSILLRSGSAFNRDVGIRHF